MPIYITFGKFDPNFGGSINITKEQLDKFHNNLLQMRLKYVKEKYIKYIYNNLQLTINPVTNEKNVKEINEISSSITTNYIIRELEEKQVDIYDFPILNNYHDVLEQNIQVFGFNNNIKILLIQENNGNYYVELECLTKPDSTTINNILSNLQ